MSTAELKERHEKIIMAIQSLPEEKLDSVEAFINEISNKKDDNSIDYIYDIAVKQYHETLQKLAK